MTAIELKNMIVKCLQNSKRISSIYTFGSIAKGVSDEYSDIDIIASVINDEIDVSEILEPRISVLYYRTFSSSSYPSGRYWFRGLSPFQKLDISFHTFSETMNIVSNGDPKTFKSPPFNCEWESKSGESFCQNIDDKNNEPIISEEENKISRHIYKLQCALKAKLRNHKEEYKQQEIVESIIDTWVQNYREKWDGGDLNDLTKQTFHQIPKYELHAYLRIEQAKSPDTENVSRHYGICKYGGNASEESTITFVGKTGKTIVGALRLAKEDGYLVLRAMQVLPILRCMGIGSKMLQSIAPILGCEKIYCLPYRHLVDFYGKIGFKTADEATLPEFLNLRLKKYLNKGLQVCAMEMN